jgi:F-type H+-transporting ATPase subunit b
MKNSIINEAKDKAKEEANKIVANAKIEIDNQRKAAVNDIKNQAGVMAIEIAESLIKKNLKGDAEQEGLVNTLVDKFNLN